MQFTTSQQWCDVLGVGFFHVLICSCLGVFYFPGLCWWYVCCLCCLSCWDILSVVSGLVSWVVFCLCFLISSCVLLCILNCWNCICFFPRCWMVFWVWPGVSILFLLVFLVFLVRCPLVLLRVCSCICFQTCTFLLGSICSLCWTWAEVGFPVVCRFFPRRLWFFFIACFASATFSLFPVMMKIFCWFASSLSISTPMIIFILFSLSPWCRVLL